MSRRFAALDLSAYPVADVTEVLDFEAYLARLSADFTSRWALAREANPELPEIDVLGLETDPIKIDLEVGAYQEMLLRGRINDAVRNLTLAGAVDRALDHIGTTYFRTERRVITEAAGTAPAVMEDDETYRRRLALAPEAWSTAGPEGAYLFFGLSASGDVLDLAAYSEDEGVCLAPEVRMVVLPRDEVEEAAVPALLSTVEAALRAEDIRPLGDLVRVVAATQLDYDIDITISVRSPSAASVIRAAAEASVRRYAEGRLRWVGEGVPGPVYLVGRTLRQDTLAAAAAIDGVVEVVVNSPAGDVNAAHPDYAALLPVAENATSALPADVVSHLFRAPKPRSVNINVVTASGNW